MAVIVDILVTIGIKLWRYGECNGDYERFIIFLILAFLGMVIFCPIFFTHEEKVGNTYYVTLDEGAIISEDYVLDEQKGQIYIIHKKFEKDSGEE